MGLKTTNYVSKSTGITLPTAYAVLTNLIIEANNQARAIFAVQSTRENAKNYRPIDVVQVYFTWDRKTDPAKMAYEAAKNKELGVLYGWENDIVCESTTK